MARSIQLRREEIESGTVGTIQGFRMRVTAHSAVGMPNEIFVYRVQVVDPETSEQRASFQNVSPAKDLEELPINGTTVDSPLLFRKDIIDVLFDDIDELDASWENLQTDVEQLIDTLNKLDVLEVTENVLIGAADEGESSSSSST